MNKILEHPFLDDLNLEFQNSELTLETVITQNIEKDLNRLKLQAKVFNKGNLLQLIEQNFDGVDVD